MTPTILVIDDDISILRSFERILGKEGWTVTTGRQAEAVLDLPDDSPPDLVLLDIRMPKGMGGFEAFRHLHERSPKLPVILMTAHSSAGSAIEAMKLGCFDYLVKPFDPRDLLDTVRRALEAGQAMKREVALGTEAPGAEADALVGQTAVMQEVYKMIGRVAATDAAVLIRGETGTGKELVARAIYQHSRRTSYPLLVINCAAIQDTLLESELFGHERGSFTGATRQHIGKFEQANGGTLFLDEIGDISPAVQAKMLRVLQDGTFQRVGGDQTLQTDVRIIAATNQDLEGAMESGAYREDLYHRLNVVPIQVPSLRERREDIPRLTSYFLRRYARELDIDVPPLAPDAQELLLNHTWPGNVRQLEHSIRRVLILTQGYALTADDLRRSLGAEAQTTLVQSESHEVLRQFVHTYLQQCPGHGAHAKLHELLDQAVILEAMRVSGGNQSKAARLLGISRPALQDRLKKYDIRTDSVVREGAG